MVVIIHVFRHIITCGGFTMLVVMLVSFVIIDFGSASMTVNRILSSIMRCIMMVVDIVEWLDGRKFTAPRDLRYWLSDGEPGRAWHFA